MPVIPDGPPVQSLSPTVNVSISNPNDSVASAM